MSIGEIDLDLAVADSRASRHSSSEGNANYSKILNACSQRMYHDFSWSISMPRVPASPMLFRPELLKEVFTAGTSVMNSEVDAMKLGILDAIPLIYYPAAPSEIRHAFDVAASSLTAAGCPPLDDKDRALLDTDIDLDLLEKRALPSLTLLKRPLYTEIGLTSVEERHQERLARLIPPHLLSLVGNTQEGLALQRSMSVNGTFFGGNGASQSPLTPGTTLDPVAQRQSKSVNQSFKFAKSVDVTFNQLMASIRVEKLGLGGALSELESSQLTRQFWDALFLNTSGAQQRRVWVAVCRYVRHVLGAAGDADTPVDLMSVISSARLHNEQTFWVQWVTQFQRALAEVDVARSKAQLSMDALDYTIPVDREQNVFKAGISVPNPLNRTSSRIIDPADNRSRLTTFPVSVRPVLPSGYTDIVDLILRGEDAYSPLVQGALASRSENLSQLIVQGVREALPRRTHQQACAEPHILVNGSLLIADDISTSGTPVVSPDMTVSSHTNGNLVFEEYLSTDADTSALLMELHPKVCLYDRITSRKEFRRNAAAVAPICEQYVICFDGSEEADSESSSKKRPREE